MKHPCLTRLSPGDIIHYFNKHKVYCCGAFFRFNTVNSDIVYLNASNEQMINLSVIEVLKIVKCPSQTV